MKGKKTGGRLKGTPNKNTKYNIHRQHIIELISKGLSQAKVVKRINNKYSNKITTSRLCEYIKETNLLKEAQEYINNNPFKEILNLRIRKTKSSNKITPKITQRINLNLKYKTPHINYKTYKIYCSRHTMKFHVGLKYADLYTLDKIELILEDYSPMLDISEIDELIYQPIYNSILHHSPRLINQAIKEGLNTESIVEVQHDENTEIDKNSILSPLFHTNNSK